LETITAIVETPAGQGLKYDFDPLLGCFKLKKVMPVGLVFPFDFGYIPGTTGGDGDPVDVLIISEVKTFPGCAIDCRVIGGIKASQRERDGSRVRNDRIIAVPEVSVQYATVKTLTDLPKGILDQLESFFRNYNQQAGKVFRPIERLSAAKAAALVRKCEDESVKKTLVQLFIPLNGRDGQRFPERWYQVLKDELTQRFGGVTVYPRSPATGLWRTEGEQAERDDLLVYEVLTGLVQQAYWHGLKNRLEKQFDQQELLVVMSQIHKL
jgi:inorganic pyrophosphatase